MRLHRLEVTAFGPFAQTAIVDFDALATDGLFVLSGDTGAGKTTILDAVSFALYGTVPGRRDARRLHSDHAPTDLAPRVVLEATLGGRRIRLARSPEHVRPKKRGDGVRIEPARATLTWIDGGRTNLTRIAEIGDEVVRLLGMSADQFFQVVLLPQGDFARFLAAPNEDREVLLERLFDTERFGDAEAWLAARRRDSEGALDKYRNVIERLAAQIGTAANTDVPMEPTSAWAESVLLAARASCSAAAGELSSCRDAAKAADAAYRDGARLADAHARLAEADRIVRELDAATPEHDAMSVEFEAARRATVVQSADIDLRRALRLATRATAHLRDIEGRFLGAVDAGEAIALSWPPADGDADRIDRQLQCWAEELGRLREVARDVESAGQATAMLDARLGESESYCRRLAALTAEATTVPDQLTEARDEFHRAQLQASEVGELAAARTGAIAAVAAAEEYVSRTAELERARHVAVECRTTHVEARERVLDLRERRLAGMAAELAAALEPGQPCAVCGSTQHPAPAEAGDDTVRAADEKNAAAAELAAGLASERAAKVVAGHERALHDLAMRGGAGDLDELRAAAASIHSRFQQARDASTRLDDITANLRTLARREAELDEQIRHCASRKAEVDVELARLQGRVDEIRARIAASGVDDPGRRMTRLTALSRTAIELREARAAAQSADDAVQRATERLANLASEAGFATVADALAAIRTPDRLSEIDARLAAVVAERARAAAILADPAVRAANEQEPPDLAFLVERRTVTDEALNVAIGRDATATERVRKLEDLVAVFWAAHDRLAPAESEHLELARIADIVAGRGANTRRMSLRSYVLAARLEDVVIAASQRLRRMSAGRYEFVHTDASGPRGRRGGLGLEIRDDYTGTVRPTGSLSGGESFTASLALALGLADVVAAESGGRVLDTLFIDEGFGSLDEETLDSVMGVLDELRAGGRVVGVVSHVDEIRQRIPNRLHVIRERAGSRLECRAG